MDDFYEKKHVYILQTFTLMLCIVINGNARYNRSVFMKVMLIIRNLNKSYDLIVIPSASKMTPQVTSSVPFQTNMERSSSSVKMFDQFSATFKLLKNVNFVFM